ncbi:MAG TPA: cytochrome c peroxidase [Polyangiaceae bacterium]|nr:cytochrome c peroxidase [Polyangiaceae bacterium]
MMRESRRSYCATAALFGAIGTAALAACSSTDGRTVMDSEFSQGLTVTDNEPQSAAAYGRNGPGRASSAAELRALIARQVGGLEKLKVPADDVSIPLPPEDPMRPGRYRTTEAKRYLGKLLFHDPVRTVRINVNKNVNPPIRAGEPRDLPEGTAFGGTVSSANPNVQSVVDATKSTGSCGSCHLGEAAGKAGSVLNFNVGGEGRGYTDEYGNYIIRRRPQKGLIARESAYLPNMKLFEGDTGVDSLPTLTDIYRVGGMLEVATPARQKADPLPEALLATGRLDQLDSVARQSPSMVGFAFNNRLLLGGFAGESNSLPAGLNPLNDPAQENLTLLLLDAHRMLDLESATLEKIPAFVELFRQAFPEEARDYEACKHANPSAACQPELDELVNDDTVLRATATFLRTAVTRNTPFDRFLAGEDSLTARQRTGAELFFTRAQEGGAGCFTCHSGPMLNKQPNDPDVAGIGKFVEQNFFNVGICDHPVQALNALRRGHLQFDSQGKPLPHGEDTGRQEITHNPDDAYKFRSLTLRQLKDARTFFHNGAFASIRDVVSYFNAGVPQDAVFAGHARTLEPRFTNPRGMSAPRGLGLSEEQIDAVTDFLENGLYDSGFVQEFQPNAADLTYSKNHPELAALGAKDGQLLSGLAIDNNDPLSRRDAGLEFLDVSSRARVDRIRNDCSGARVEDVYRITNTSDSVIDTHLLLVVRGLTSKVRLTNASGVTRSGDPYIRVFLPNGVLEPVERLTQRFVFDNPGNKRMPNYTITLLSGQGTP